MTSKQRARHEKRLQFVNLQNNHSFSSLFRGENATGSNSHL
jgi:hypothetical protein